MKKTLTTLLIFCVYYSFGQQDPYYTHFKYNTQSYNPAAAGEHEGFICLTGVTHYQWRDFDDVTAERGTDGQPGTSIDNVAPETHNITVGTMFGLGKNGTDFIGAGLSVVDDNVGFTKNTQFLVDLNYKRDFQGGFNQIAAGVGLGFQQFGIVKPKYKFRDPSDPFIPQTEGNQGKFNMNAGVMYKQKRLGPMVDFFAGASVTQITGALYENFIQNYTYKRKFVQHYYAIAGADYDMGNITLEPAVLMKYAFLGSGSSFRPQFDLNMTALLAETFRGGIAYRQWANVDAISILVGYQTEKFKIGYSYDVTVTNVQSVSAGTHEVMVKYCIPISYEEKPDVRRLTPRFL